MAKTLRDARSALNKVLARRLDEATWNDLIGALIDAGKAQSVVAINTLMDRVAGKPQVGGAATIADNEFADALAHNLERLSPEEIRTYLELQRKLGLDEAPEPPLVIEAQVAPGSIEPANVTEEA